MLQAINAPERNYLPNKQVNGNGREMHKRIISKQFKTGTGYVTYMEYLQSSALGASTDYVHWDDHNEFVERLRMLIASQNSGNTTHTNEFVSIGEELREAGIIV